MKDVCFYNDYFGLAVGHSGTVMKSIDGGLNWRTISTYFTDRIEKIEIVSSQVSYLLLTNQIIKSTNAGESWFNIPIPPLNFFTDFEFINENKGYVTGNSNKIYFTTDGGNNWIDLPIGVSAYIGSIEFLDENYGIIAGYTSTQSENIVLNTNDGGLTWSNYLFSNATLLNAADMKILSSTKAFIIGNSRLLRTTNGGINWEWVNFNSSDQLLSIDFLDSLNGFITSVSRIIKTSDGGISWTELNLNIGNNIWLYGLSIPSPNLIYMVGLFGKMIYSTNHGNSWEILSSGPIIDFNDVSFYNRTNGIAVGGFGGVVTTDGGMSWIVTSGNSGYRCSMPSSSICFSAGGYNLSKSTDGGFTWSRHPISNDNYFMAISFMDTLLGISSTGNKIFRTSDGGINWEHITSLINYNIKDICFIDSLTIYACGWGVFKSTDGGYTWNIISNYNCGGIDFIDPLIGFAVGGRNIIKTTDGGQTWENFYINSSSYLALNQVSLTDLNHVIAIGKGIAFTDDGGSSWQIFNPADDMLTSGIMINDSLFCVVGSSGVILDYKINSVIPVELTSFTSSVIENDVTLSWQTATETNNQGFQIERRKTQDERSEDWNSIGFVNGNGTTTEPQSYSFADKNLEAGRYQYRLKQIDFDGTFEYSNVIEVEIVGPLKFSLEQNYPNPFNPSTKIKYTIPTSPSSSPFAKGRNEVGFVTLKVYDVLGKEIVTLVNEEKPSGHYEINFDASNLASGIYYYQLRAGEFVETKKMTLLK